MKTIFLALDFMVGTADQEYALQASQRALKAIDSARRRACLIVFTKVGFHAGHSEISSRNKIFGPLLGTERLIGSDSRLLETFVPGREEPILDKKRFSAFSGSGLWTILRACGAGSVVMCGLSTSGVVLSTALELIDADFEVTVLSDACADPNPKVHETILYDILGPRLALCTVDAWVAEHGTLGGGADEFAQIKPK